MTNPLLQKHIRELRDTWQGRALAESKGQTQVVMLAILLHGYYEAMQLLLRVVYPQMRGNDICELIVRPPIEGGAQILRNGKVAALVRKGKAQPRAEVLYESQDALIKEFRSLADRLKLSDRDRIEMMAAVAKWVVADRRIDHMGEKLAS